MRYGSLFDSTQTMVSKIADDLYEVQVVSWYDNENSYTSQMVRTIKYFAELSIIISSIISSILSIRPDKKVRSQWTGPFFFVGAIMLYSA